jgi:hypothetical protein
MDRRSRCRIEKCEELLSAAKQGQDERLKQWLRVAPAHARPHATAVAAMVLAGQPRIDEPLFRAWARTLQHYKIDNKDQVVASERLIPMIIGDRSESETFSEIFQTAPAWLLQFTAMALDARLLQFDLSDNISDTLRWGSVGFINAQRWPLLPTGTMMAGDAIPRLDARRLWIVMNCMITVPFPDVDDLSRTAEQVGSQCEGESHFQDLLLALDLDGKPESKWSNNERRRMRNVSEWISRLQG